VSARTASFLVQAAGLKILLGFECWMRAAYRLGSQKEENMRLAGKVAIITGGGKGIGKAIALAFGREGAAVVIAARSVPELEKTCHEVIDKGGKAI
jgi:hypothetical protein